MAVAGSITTTTSDIGGGYTKYSMAWLSDGAGIVTENPVPIQRGHIHQVKFIPDAGATQPDAAYDITLIDAITGGIDFLTGIGANLSQTVRKIGIILCDKIFRSYIALIAERELRQ